MTEPKPDRIAPTLSAFDTTMVVVSLVVGIGIFRTPAIVARHAGSAALVLSAWAIGGAVSLAGAWTFAEIGSRLPRAGGYYKVVAHCWHPALAFMLNWTQVVMQGAGAAGVSFIGADYLALLVVPEPLRGPRVSTALAVAMMTALLALNAAGIRWGSRTQNALSVGKIAMILGLGAVALAVRASGAPAPAAQGGSLPGFLAALVPVFYAYGGYQNTMNLGGDIRDPSRQLPRSIAAGMLVVGALYLFVNAGYLRALGATGVAGADLVAAATARSCLGAGGEAVVSIAIALSAAGFVNATILQVPRSYYAMAEDGALPSWFLAVDSKTQAQGPGLVFLGATMLVPAMFIGSFEKLLDYVMFTDSLMLVVVAASIFVLRRRDPGSGSFRVPGYPVVPAVFIAVLLGVSIHVLVAETRLALVGAAILAAGYPLFRILRRVSGGATGP